MATLIASGGPFITCFQSRTVVQTASRELAAGVAMKIRNSWRVVGLVSDLARLSPVGRRADLAAAEQFDAQLQHRDVAIRQGAEDPKRPARTRARTSAECIRGSAIGRDPAWRVWPSRRPSDTTAARGTTHTGVWRFNYARLGRQPSGNTDGTAPPETPGRRP